MDVLTKKLEIANLIHRYDQVNILEDITFDVFESEFLSILGPSGCGKSTLLRLLIGLLIPCSGTIYKDGKDITTSPPSERGMGIVFQNYALFGNMTVLKNIEYALHLNKAYKLNSKKIALDIVEQMGLTEHIYKKPSQLSGGQQQRVAIARTLALKPDIILFDEPMAALDAESKNNFRLEIKKIKTLFDTTIVYVTHDQEEAFSMSDRIMIMGKNNVHQIDTPENIIKHPKTPFVQSFVIENLKQKAESLYQFIGDLL